MGSLLTMLGLRRTAAKPSVQAKDTYGLLPGHPKSLPSYVVNVTNHLTPEVRELLSYKLPQGTQYQAFLGVPPGLLPLDPEVPVVVGINPHGHSSCYLTPGGLSFGDLSNRELGSRKDLFYDMALLALMKNEVTASARQEIVRMFADDCYKKGDYDTLQRDILELAVEGPLPLPRQQVFWPGKYFRLVNTVAHVLPIQSQLQLPP